MKDASALYLDAPERFVERVEALVSQAKVPGSELGQVLLDVEAFVRKYIVLPSEHEGVAITLWAAHSYAYESFDTSAYLAITSAEKRCGKTRTLDVIALLVARPWRAVMPSEAVVYRKIDADRPTLLLDEVDAIFGPGMPKQYEGLRALLNAGNRRGTTVPRVSSPSMKLQEFNVFGPKVIAGIGELPETIADRCIPIRLKRKSPREVVEKFRVRFASVEAEPLSVALASAISAHAFGGGCEIPETLDDRAADSWEALLEVAIHAGGDWPRRSVAAALTLSGGRDSDSDSIGVRLLSDIAKCFAENDGEPVLTRDLVPYLNSLEESSWGDYGRDGLKDSTLARLLRPYGIRPGNIRRGDAVLKGYEPPNFTDAFERYL